MIITTTVYMDLCGLGIDLYRLHMDSIWILNGVLMTTWSRVPCICPAGHLQKYDVKSSSTISWMPGLLQKVHINPYESCHQLGE